VLRRLVTPGRVPRLVVPGVLLSLVQVRLAGVPLLALVREVTPCDSRLSGLWLPVAFSILGPLLVPTSLYLVWHLVSGRSVLLSRFGRDFCSLSFLTLGSLLSVSISDTGFFFFLFFLEASSSVKNSAVHISDTGFSSLPQF
jgi:hypothetical protein